MINVKLASPDGKPSSCTTTLHLGPGLWALFAEHGDCLPVWSAGGVVGVLVEDALRLTAYPVDVDGLTAPDCREVIEALDIDTEAKTPRGMRAAIKRHTEG